MKPRVRQHLLAIFKAGLAAADPVAAVHRYVARRGLKLRIGGHSWNLSRVRNIFVIGAGKASARMAEALENILGDRITEGWINVKAAQSLAPRSARRSAERRRRVHLHEAGHPIPDEAGLRGAREVLRIAHSARAGDLILVCLSGGGSALLPLPVEGVSLAEKRKVTESLLACGAEIREVNTVRKHLSQLKGGRLAQAAGRAEVVTLILSDVVGDPLDVIASGPTAPDATTFSQSLGVLRKYGLENRTPRRILEHLRAGEAGMKPETPKPGSPVFKRVWNILIANNSAVVEACGRKAREIGYRPLILSTSIEGEARQIARMHVAIARESLRHGRPVGPPACLVSGGETTVTLLGGGLGGRNQEFALAAAIASEGMKEVAILAAGTDGTDGPTDAAGAFADGRTCERASWLGRSAAAYLARHDSYRFFQPLGDLLITGPTGTNVMDLYILLVGEALQRG